MGPFLFVDKAGTLSRTPAQDQFIVFAELLADGTCRVSQLPSASVLD